MSESHRLFIAVTVATSPAIVELLSQLRNSGRGIKSVTESQLHITLKFLGDTSVEQQTPITEHLDRIASETPAFTYALKGIGFFPHRRRPTVAWIGVHDSGEFAALANHLQPTLTDMGFAQEDRVYRPHLTIARLNARPTPAFWSIIDDWEDKDFGTETATAIELYESKLTPSGPIYRVIHRSALASAYPMD